METQNKNTNMTAPVILEPLLTRSELQAVLKVSGRTIGRLVAAGGFPAPIMVGQSCRWRAEDVAGYLGGKK
jgi:excisionase family DNA binding protein